MLYAYGQHGGDMFLVVRLALLLAPQQKTHRYARVFVCSRLRVYVYSRAVTQGPKPSTPPDALPLLGSLPFETAAAPEGLTIEAS